MFDERAQDCKAENHSLSHPPILNLISAGDLPRLKKGVLVAPRSDGLFVGTFDDALILDLPGARAALAQCDGSNSIGQIANLVGMAVTDLLKLISTLDHASFITFESTKNQHLISELQLLDWYPQNSNLPDSNNLEKRANAIINISKLNRIGMALSGILAASGVGTITSEDDRKISTNDLVGGYLRLSDVGRSRSDVLKDQIRESSYVKSVISTKSHKLIIATTTPEPELLADWMRGTTPFFLINGLDRDNLTFGPFVIPGQTPCPRCIDLHFIDRDPNWSSVTLSQFLDRRREIPTAMALLGASLGAIFALAQIDHGDQLDPGLNGKTFTYSASDLSRPIIRRWGRHPLCGCAWK